MQISKRTLHIPTSPIRKLAPIANEVEKTKKVYHLNIGQPDITTPESFFEGVRNYHCRVLEYGKSQGDAPLLRSIQNYYKAGTLIFLWMIFTLLTGAVRPFPLPFRLPVT